MTTVPSILTIDGLYIERVTAYKYLRIWLDEKLTFDLYIDCLNQDWVFVSAKKKSFSFEVRKRIIQTMFLPILDYGDCIYMHASLYLLKRLDSVYYAAL